MEFEEYYKNIQRIKQIGGIMMGVLGVFWIQVISVEPNPLLRCIFFTASFGSTAWAFAQPFIWLAKWQQSTYYTGERTQ